MPVPQTSIPAPRSPGQGRIGPALRTFVRAAALAAALALPAFGPALAQTPGSEPAEAQPAPTVTTEELEGLVRTLRDDAARQAFLANLEALLEARRDQERAKAAAPPSLADRIVQSATSQVQRFSDRMTQVVGVVRHAPGLIGWAESQVMVEGKRDRLIGLAWRFLVIVGIGMGVQYGFRKSTGMARRRLEAVPPEEPLIAHAVRFVLRTLMLYLNALAYGVGAYAAYLVLPMEAPAGAILFVGASAFFVAKLILATARMAVSPGVPGLRLWSMSPETAQYLYLWVRRMVRIFIYGFFLLEATRLAGLPEPAYESLLYILGLAFIGFLIVFVMQNRAAVAAVIRGAGRESLGGGARARLAGMWHLAVIAYIVAVYLVWLFQVPGGFDFLVIATLSTLAIAIVARLVMGLANRILDRALHVGEELAERYPGLEERANRYMPVLRGLIRWTVLIAATLIVLDVWGVNTLEWVTSEEGTILIRKLIFIGLITLISLAAWEAVNLLIARKLDRLAAMPQGTARARTLLPLARTAAAIVIIVFATLIVLSEIGVNIGPLLAGAGVVGLAIGFGSQKLVQDVITGVFILAEDTLAVGDVVQLSADHSGLVEALSIRTVRLRDLSGNVHVLPFSEVHTILNMTKGFGFYVADVGVAYREDVDRIIEVLKDLGREMQEDEEYGQFITDPIEILGLDRFDDSAVIVRARLRIEPPIRRWYVGREFNRRLKARFDRDGIEIPFPHRTIYFGEDQKGNAPPLRVASVGPRADANADMALEPPPKPAD